MSANRTDLSPTGMLPSEVEHLATERAHEPVGWLRLVLQSAAAVAGVALVLSLGGCSCPIKNQDVQSLRKAIHDERKAVAPRAGLEEAVAVERAGVDAKLDAMDTATR